MKRFLYLVFFGVSVLLGGCVASQDEIQTLKVKVLNLETTIQTQTQNQKAVEKELSQLRERVESLEKKLGEDLLLEIKTKALSELEDLKSSQAKLVSQVEDLSSSKEDLYKTFNKQSEELKTRIEALELKVKALEEKVASKPQESSQPSSNGSVSNQTAKVVSNATVETKPSEVKASTDETLQQGSLDRKEPSEIDLYNRAFDLYQQKKFDEAITAFKEYIQKYPKGKFLAQSYYWLGEIYYNKKAYEDAILSFQKVIETPGPATLKSSAMYKQALSFKALGDKDAYTILLKRIVKLYPTSKEAKEAKKLLGIK
ncbi:tol-pal system protein YbgF [Thermodesulfobacterium sp. TA1]|uniref:tol-pal system protein YbgF n=1 Tax=Thermodesulfobacterium sp. TA1 TaxID=2234087 RepID=UPI0012322973|nr:tol-pal system protein YbgF [Thermodesulfobacterium sp. TA1]QER41253.1 tol-pal system protein YbgF [Thermodesulfobacterium sp. TA1]